MGLRSKKTYLVTGGSGFIGSSLVKALVAKGSKVRVLDDNSRGHARRLKEVMPRIEFVSGDIRNPKVVDKAIKGVDVVCHLAFVNGTEFFYTKPDYVLDVGVKGIVNVIDACRKHSVDELVLASSSEVYQTPLHVPTDETAALSIPDPLNPRYSYGAAKIISEIMTINYGRKYFKRAVIFRPHNVYGPDMGWEHVVPQLVLRMKKLAAATRGKIVFPIQGTGRETRAFVYIDDFTQGLMKVIEKGKHLGIYHIGTKEEIAISQVAKSVAAFYGRTIQIKPGTLAQGGTLRRCPDIQKLVALGYKPRYSFADGLKITAKWYDEHSADR